MGNGTGLTAARMLQIEAACIVAGAVDLSGHLQLTKKDGSSLDAGLVRGPQGVVGPTGPAGVGAVPGVMFRFAGSVCPSGFLFCDGSSLLRTDYPALFAAIGTTYGAADATHFYLPDNQGWRGLTTAASSVPNSAWFQIAPGTDTGAGYVSKSGKYYGSGAAGGYTIVSPGLYDLYFEVSFVGSTTGPRIVAAIFKNNAEICRADYTMGTRGTNTTSSVSKSEPLKTGDFLEFRVWQTTGAALTLSTNPGAVVELRPIDVGDIIKT